MRIITLLNLQQNWQKSWSVLRLYWVSEEKWKAWRQLALLIFVLLIRTGLQVPFLIFGGEVTSALAAQDTDRFIQAVLIFLGILVVGVPFASLADYLGSKLALSWRDWLTSYYLTRYLEDARFYQLRLRKNSLDNPDQRIEADIRALTQGAIKFFAIGLESIFQLLGIAGVLWAISQGLMVFLLVYSVTGTAIATLFFGRMLVGINQEQLQREADFRFNLARIRENAEAIALYSGENYEFNQSWAQFLRVFSNFKRLIQWQLGLNLFQNPYRYATFVIPGLILAPRLFAGELEIGDVTQAGAAFKIMLAAMALIVLQMQQLANLGAAVQRLGELDQALTQVLMQETVINQQTPRIQQEVGNFIDLDRLTVQTPDGRVLIRNLSATVAPEDHLLIVGASGVGKSSLLRAIAGLWQFGSGTITKPESDQIMFLPQRPYLIRGSLREQLIYPYRLPSLTDAALEAVLKQVNLAELLDRWEGLDGGIEEMSTLSVGEKQRLAFARLLLHKPLYALLDEATNALDFRNEASLYKSLKATDTTFISVGHNPALKKYHEQILEIKVIGNREQQSL